MPDCGINELQRLNSRRGSRGCADCLVVEINSLDARLSRCITQGASFGKKSTRTPRGAKQFWVLRTSCDDLRAADRIMDIELCSHWGFYGRRSWPVRVTLRRRQTNHPFRYHRNAAVGRGDKLGAPGELPEVLARKFSPAWSVLAPAPGSTLHGPICDSVRTSAALQVPQSTMPSSDIR